MLTDANDLPDGSVLDGDVCVVGAGPAGIALALSLGEAGLRVVLVESGGRSVTREQERLAAGDSVGHPYFPLERSRARAFGGTSHLWDDNGWFRGRPLDAWDLSARPAIAHSGWPITSAQLEPYYRAAHDWCGLGEYNYRPERWATAERPQLPWTVGGPLVTSVFKLAPPGIWRERFDTVVAHEAIQLVLHANVVELVTTGAGRVTRADVVTLTGGALSVRAQEFVLAAGGIDNARLLLVSRGRDPRGIGNQHDLVGRFFMEHLHVRSGRLRLRDRDLASHLRLYERHDAGEGDVKVHAKLSVRPDVLADIGAANATFYLQPMTETRASDAMRSLITLSHVATWRPLPPDLGRHVAQVLRHPGVIPAAVRERRRRGAPEVVQLMAMAEQVPNPESRVTLGRDTDAVGLPVARLDWRLTDLDRHSIRRSQDVIAEHLRQVRAGRFEDALGDEDPPREIKGAWHHIGTTRMDPEPRWGVVDEHCRVHGTDNLHVAGSSVFPTGGYANPTLTVVALALRLADHLAGRPGRGTSRSTEPIDNHR